MAVSKNSNAYGVPLESPRESDFGIVIAIVLAVFANNADFVAAVVMGISFSSAIVAKGGNAGCAGKWARSGLRALEVERVM